MASGTTTVPHERDGQDVHPAPGAEEWGDGERDVVGEVRAGQQVDDVHVTLPCQHAFRWARRAGRGIKQASSCDTVSLMILPAPATSPSLAGVGPTVARIVEREQPDWEGPWSPAGSGGVPERSIALCQPMADRASGAEVEAAKRVSRKPGG